MTPIHAELRSLELMKVGFFPRLDSGELYKQLESGGKQ